MKNLTIIFLLLLTTVISAQEMKIYELKKGVDYGIGAAATIMAGVDFALLGGLTSLSEEDILILNAEDIWSIDRSTTKQYSLKAKNLSNFFEYGAVFLPAPLLFSRNIRRESKQIMVMYLEAFSLNLFSTHLVKFSTTRIRPFVYNPDVEIGAKKSKNALASFYSGHVSHTATLSFFTAKVYSDFYPESKWRSLIWATAAAIPITTGYLRYKAGQHYPTDIFTGMLAGSLIGYFVPELHKIKNDLPEGLSINSANNGIGLMYNF